MQQNSQKYWFNNLIHFSILTHLNGGTVGQRKYGSLSVASALFPLRIGGQVTPGLLQGLDDLKLCGRGEVGALFPQEQPEEAGDVPAGDVDPHDGMPDGEALVDGDGVRHAVSAVEDHARCSPRGVPESRDVNDNWRE